MNHEPSSQPESYHLTPAHPLVELALIMEPGDTSTLPLAVTHAPTPEGIIIPAEQLVGAIISAVRHAQKQRRQAGLSDELHYPPQLYIRLPIMQPPSEQVNTPQKEALLEIRHQYEEGELLVSQARRSVFFNDEEIPHLRRKEFDILYLMARYEVGKVWTRQELARYIWDTDTGFQSRTLDVHIRYLRSKLGDASVLIGNKRGVGYFLRRPLASEYTPYDT